MASAAGAFRILDDVVQHRPPESRSELRTRRAKAMADVSISPGHTGPVTASIVVITGDFGPLETKEVTLVLSNPAADIEPIRRPTAKPRHGTWRVENLTIPVPSRWTVQSAILVSDFDLIRLEDNFTTWKACPRTRRVPLEFQRRLRVNSLNP